VEILIRFVSDSLSRVLAAIIIPFSPNIAMVAVRQHLPRSDLR